MSHILIIDDDIHINEMLEEVLIQEGYQVSHAYSGTEALLFLANEKPDLILLDLMLPAELINKFFRTIRTHIKTK